MKKRWLYSIAFLIFSAGISVFLFPKQPGFTVKKISSPLVPSAKWDVERLNPYEKEEVRAALSQKYNYLGSGAECYAFLSADGKYVLKFFKMKHFLPKNWLKWIPLPGLEKYRFQKIDKRILRQHELFSGYKMAYKELKKETGLLFIHLNKTQDLGIKVELFDRMRNRYLVNLDRYEFIMQKKGQLIADRLTACMQKGKIDEAKKAIHALLEQVVVQCEKGYVDKDSGISHNYGFVGDEVIHFDVGRIQKDEKAKDPSHYQREVLRVGRKLENWATIHYPELLPYLEEEINAMIDLSPESP